MKTNLIAQATTWMYRPCFWMPNLLILCTFNEIDWPFMTIEYLFYEIEWLMY